MPALYRPDRGTDEFCPGNPDGHEPDWSTVSICEDGGDVYLDVACRHCGRSGCLGVLQKLEENISW